MELIKVEVEVTKEVYELAMAIQKIGIKVMDLYKDGKWSYVDDTAALLGEIMAVMGPAIEGFDLLDDEFIQQPIEATTASIVPALKLAAEALKARKAVKAG
jgi:hypothetical protein